MHKSDGLTLIEVLIALAIISIALTAIIKATSQSIKDTIYLQNKTVANWVGLYVINQARLGLIHPPNAPEKLSENIQMLGLKWTTQVFLKSTRNPAIQEIDVDILENSTQQQRIHLTSYRYAPKNQ